MAGVLVIAVIAFMTLFPGLFTHFSPMDQNAGPQLAKPSSAHIMGIDNLGRDVGARVVYGARTILGVAIAASLLSALIGIPLGLISGFAGNWLDKVLSLVMDSVYSFPGLILAIAFAAMLGPGVINITLAVSRRIYPDLLPSGARPDPLDQGRALRRGSPRDRREAEHNTRQVRIPERHRHRRGRVLAQYRRRDHDRGGAVLYRPRPPRRHPGLGHGPLDGQEVPAFGRVVDDHLSRDL